MSQEALVNSSNLDQSNNNPPLEFNVGPVDVLILEDEELMAALVQRYIQHFNQELPQSLRNLRLESGWRLLNADLSQVKIVVVDILLPQVTGDHLIRHFRQHYPNMGIVPITGMATGPMRWQIQEALPQGFEILDKPLRKSSFLEAFKKAYDFSVQSGSQPKVVAPAPATPSEEIWSSAVASSIPKPQFKRKPKAKDKAS